MALTIYKEHFDNAYQEIFQKVLVAKSIANLRFEPVLKYGESVERVAYDISAVRVRTVVRGNQSTIDAITDTSELLTIDLEKEAVFHISDGEVKQAGPLNPGEVIGGQVAIKVAADFDARVLAETLNATLDFDTGDLTTLSSNGTPITMSSTTVPQMVSRMPAKLRSRNQTLNNLALVIDSYGASDIEQYLLSKNIDIAASTFKNGYAGPVRGAEMYVSENLTATALFTMGTNASNGQTVTINGIVWTFVTTIGATPGNVLIGGDADASRLNLANAINNPGTTSANQVALSAANQNIVTDTLRLAAVDSASANTITLTGTGSGSLTLATNVTSATWTLNCVHAYFGKKGAIDAVLQDMKEVDMRPTADRRGTNVFTSYLGGIKTFTDGKAKFLDVLIAR